MVLSVSPACLHTRWKSLDFHELFYRKELRENKVVAHPHHLILWHEELVPVCGRVTLILWIVEFNPGGEELHVNLVL